MGVFTANDFPRAPRYRGSFFPVGLCNFYTKTSLDAFRTQVIASDGEHDTIAFVRDVAVLLDQKAINSKGLEGVVNAILSNVRTSSVSDRFNHLSDDQLISVIKSRYIQAPCELLSWSEWLEDNLTALEKAALEVEPVDPVQPTEPPTPPAD